MVRHPSPRSVPALVVALAATGGVLTWCAPDAAAAWAVGLGAARAGEGHAGTVPPAPTGINVTCPAPSSSASVTVTWNAVGVTGAAVTYTVSGSANGANGTYYALASGLTTTTVTSGSEPAGTYYVEVVAKIGANWTSPPSTAFGPVTLRSANPYCTP